MSEALSAHAHSSYLWVSIAKLRALSNTVHVQTLGTDVELHTCYFNQGDELFSMFILGPPTLGHPS